MDTTRGEDTVVKGSHGKQAFLPEQMDCLYSCFIG